MSDFRKLAHLAEQLGDDLFEILICSDNTGRVKDFCIRLMNDDLPIEMNVGGRVYDILSFLQGDEKSVDGTVMVSRSQEMQASLDEKEARHILKHQDDIPVKMKGKVTFFFTGWRNPPDNLEEVACIYHDDKCWVSDWEILDGGGFFGSGRVLRRD